jgi:hypothetical protein
MFSLQLKKLVSVLVACLVSILLMVVAALALYYIRWLSHTCRPHQSEEASKDKENGVVLALNKKHLAAA